MEHILKFWLPNLYPITIVTKKERFLKEKKRERIFFIFMTMLSFKQVESNYGKKEPCKQGCVGLLIFSLFEFWIPLIWYYFFNLIQIWLYMLQPQKKNLWSEQLLMRFLRRVNFIFKFFQEELASLLSAGKPFLSDLEC